MRRTQLKRTALKRKPLKQNEQLASSSKQAQFRAGNRCEAQVFGCGMVGNQAHHVKLRSAGGEHTPQNLLWVCAACHRWIHDNPAAAKEKRLLQN